MAEPPEYFNTLPPAAGTDTEVDELVEYLSELREQEKLNAKKAPDANVIIFRDGIGCFMRPIEPTWAAHRELVRAPQYHMAFSPKNYAFFDDLIHQYIDEKGVWDTINNHYEGYEVLRENLAVLRNYILCEFFKDGSVDDTHFDRRKATQLAQIADFITDGLNNDHLLRNPFTTRIEMDRANLPGTGVQYLYQKILEQQEQVSWLSPFSEIYRILTRKADCQWELPPLEQSPFSDAMLRMPPPRPRTSISDAELLDVMPMANRDERTPLNVQQAATEQLSNELDQIADEFMLAGALASGLENLQEPARRESIEIAKDILEKLRVKLGQTFLGNGLNAFDNESFAILDALKTVVSVYQFHLFKLAGLDSGIFDNPAVIAANQSIGKLSYIAKTETLHTARKHGHSAIAAKVEADLLSMPDSWIPNPKEQFNQLFNNLDGGLKTVLTRMTQLAQQDTSAAQWLGFTNQKSLGKESHGLENGGAAPQKEMKNDEFYRQMNAQRAMQARQAAMRHIQKQQQQQQQQTNSMAQDVTAKRAIPQLGNLLGAEQILSIRNAMKTAPNTQPVQTAANTNTAQLIIQQREQAVRAQRKATENAKRESKRSQEAQEKHELDQKKESKSLFGKRKQQGPGI